MSAHTRILDMGCGDGIFLKRYKKRDDLFVGVDASPKMCELHSKHDGCIVVNADFDEPFFAKRIEDEFGRFDLLLSSSALVKRFKSPYIEDRLAFRETGHHFAGWPCPPRAECLPETAWQPDCKKKRSLH